jgi:hypothetical protein
MLLDLSAGYAPKPSDFTPATGHEGYAISLTLSPDRPANLNVPAAKVGFAGGHVLLEQSARMELLTNPRPHGSEFGFIVVEGGTDAVVLDGMYMKNVIVRNARIIGSEREFGETRILGGFLKNDEFGLGDRHALGLEQ